MNPSQLKAQAAALYQWQRTQSGFAPKSEVLRIKRQVKSLARKISRNATAIEETHAMMYLDNICTRMGWEVEYKE